MPIRALAAPAAGAPFEPFEYEPGPLGPDDVEIDVIACGLCHSDLSMWKNEWEMSSYPLVPGHEVVGRIAAVGAHVTHLARGQVVGLGWFSGSCMVCDSCMRGDHNLCGTAEQTIVGRPGGFAEKVRCKAEWAVPLPDGLDVERAGPLFCGGITVFNPIVQFDVRPTDRVGVVGIGGLGHLAVQFLHRWGCEVTAFTSNPAKAELARELGAHRVVDSRDPAQLETVAGRLDFILSTVNVDLDWPLYLGALGPRGRLHTVGAVPSPIPAPAFALIVGQKSISGSPLGSPATLRAMLEFCARHSIAAVTETFPMSRVDDAMAHLEAGRARFRIVLEADFA
ncbi:MAG: NAD(P)-dependent alcohol dehydrogenase [Acidobacteriota bacterium]